MCEKPAQGPDRVLGCHGNGHESAEVLSWPLSVLLELLL
jgi:hypothetical protein